MERTCLLPLAGKEANYRYGMKMVELDIRTLSLLGSFISGILCLVMVVIFRTRQTYPGFGCWVFAAGSTLVGVLLVGLRGSIPDLLSIVAANVLVAFGFALMTRGVHRFFHQQLKGTFFLGPLALVAIYLCYFTIVEPSVSARIAGISVAMAWYSLLSAYVTIAAVARKGQIGHAVLVYGPLVIMGMYYLFRAGYTLAFERAIEDFLSASSFQALSFLVGIGCNLMLYSGFIIQNSQRLEQELRAANAAIRTLEGIIPICMHCKQIRDDQGYWNKLETFISSHTEAQFSHSICDSCMTRLYPELESEK